MPHQRSRARDVALQLLYQHELNPRMARDAVVRFVHERLNDPDDLEPFALALYEGVLQKRHEIDRRLAQAAENWKVPRMAVVDRNVLRLGGYELLHVPETPAAVVLDEAIELARRYGSADSPAFVNGVLDRLSKSIAPAATPAG
jgi:transcription antitermination protein NusB